MDNLNNNNTNYYNPDKNRVSQLQRMNYHLSHLPGAPVCPGAPKMGSTLTLGK